MITSVTKTLPRSYRPSANHAKCIGAEAGGWYDSKNGFCFNGFATNIAFNLKSLNVTLPTTFVYGIAYNTSDYGAAPYGHATACYSSSGGCGYNSLNVGLSSDPDNLNKGTNPYSGYVWWNTLNKGFYCDNGAAGTGTFRIDSPSTRVLGCVLALQHRALGHAGGAVHRRLNRVLLARRSAYTRRRAT